jgi:hypothetical protein
MHKRSFVAIMVVLLIAGMVSSAACEMTCNPTGLMTACCAQQSHKLPVHAMSHSMDSCTNARTVSMTSAQQCGHPQESAAVPTISTQVVQPHATETVTTLLTVASFIAGNSDTLSSIPLNQSSFLAPLRI